MKKLNLGCGLDYRNGWINLDFNKKVKADVYANIEKKLPFKDNEFDYILLDNVLEHITPVKYIPFLEELHRICKKGAKINIFVPHYKGMYAFKHPTHYKFFGVGSFDIFRPEECFNGERYSEIRFKLLNEELLFFHHNLVSFKFLSKVHINYLFNISRKMQLFMERFQFLGFDEIHYTLEVLK